ncbi:MAG: hypothetical protein J7527_08795 [Chitinophagaceae bacterium]|nr:hypothetical protein [Chitinophagaceae bacterium]
MSSSGSAPQQTVLIDAMEVFHRALLRRAASIVVAHNHPAGSLKPSRSDITATEKLVEASRFLDIKFHDHLIISETEFYSFRDGGEFEKMNTRKFIMFNSVLAME